MRYARSLTTFCILVAIVDNAAAEEVGWLTLRSHAEADRAEAILDHAFVRVGNRFVVGVDSEERQGLREAGLVFETLFSDRSPRDLFLIHPKDGPVENGTSDRELERSVQLNDEMRLAALTPPLAAGINESRLFFATPLTDLHARLRYVPPAVSGYLSQLEDYPSDSLVARVSLDSLYAWDTRLEAFQTRYIWSDSIDAARDWIIGKLLDWGYTDVSVQPFEFNGGTHYNVVCVKPGYAEPDKTIVIGGHYDSINNGSDPLVFAPGADDNGSGTALTMEIARVLADVPLRKTVIFMAFSAEEQGLVGSEYAATQFAIAGTDIEVMYNYDMVAYDPYMAREIHVTSAGTIDAYADLSAEAALRVTSLTTGPTTASGGGSDHQSFRNEGYNVVNNIESEFNFGGWHTNQDISSRLDFEYFTEVTKMGLAAIAIVADAAHPTAVENIVDVGNGQSLEVFWSDCDPTYTYRVLWGSSSGNYTDSMTVAAGACSTTISGLTDGVRYFVSVVGDAPDGYPAVYSVEGSRTPLVVPRVPTQFSASPDSAAIILAWEDNLEADIAGYNVYRLMEGSDWVLFKSNLPTSSFVDSTVYPHLTYRYRVTAVDSDANESDLSPESEAVPASFDLGILVVDETSATGGGLPQEDHEAFLDSVFGETEYSLVRLEEDTLALSRSLAGQYSSIFWFDDDVNRNYINNSSDSLAWYAKYAAHILVSGHRTIQSWGTAGPEPGEIRYEEFGLQDVTYRLNLFDFKGASGIAGWPPLTVDTARAIAAWSEKYLPVIPKFEARAGADVIYTYESSIADPEYQGQPVGLLFQKGDSYRILLGFPLTYLTRESAEALMAYVKSLFGVDMYVSSNGDVNNSGEVTVADLTFLVAALYVGGPTPLLPNNADVDGSCDINVGDLTYLLGFIFGDGPEPMPGCVE